MFPKSGEEAAVYVVRCGNEIRCAKVYKEADQRGFKTAVQYTEGRKVRNSRKPRGMKGSRYGRRELEKAWQTSEVDALFRLAAAGVRVPKPYGFFEGELLMALVTDEDGSAASERPHAGARAGLAISHRADPRDRAHARRRAGACDLSHYNVLLGADGLVIIDLPQAVDAASNTSAFSMRARDVANMDDYVGQFHRNCATAITPGKSGCYMKQAGCTPMSSRASENKTLKHSASCFGGA